MSERDNVNDKSRVSDTIISAFQEAGYAPRLHYTDVLYSVVVIDLSDGSVLYVTDPHFSVHEPVDEHIGPLVIAHLPDPELPEVCTFIYQGADGMTLAEDIAACIATVSAFMTTI
ncbi:hypothetical protein [Streptomyces rimosus]|uniref:hypothetical protein n=1 Tax=Streptomyces rimosus TaxID=1927 RepID=UPI0004C6B146|nr:hypothetical protein [Streptomyces rimosus]